MASALTSFCSRLGNPPTALDWALAISLLATLLFAESTFVLAKQNPAVSTPRNIQTGLENRQADTPDWSKYRVAGLSK
ncbi:hypothetical protein SynA1544_02778 [Synechococcus sp. A15-44]|nr:hypothetical protein SynA1544_02778 [Synechococcus sp. A15-44]